eukprot:CAMPEP_0198335056 /NCGR_PEP_ID=MMETSP1450-20131203/20039_1 /TAXON_ID=753684 ORGANISM="Madagascaria erythrocladiodes, Strain CCMP3234" /NCGR_SAMPLE_ID=MMETSP1450 /ASSEMBLY_ACC=CAM_ASM_001115 /LENGTH=133 /DNA_ID=CAMNT_0044039687 /DNA_START=462 /DNA_END=863 /DNA_ORIENTATION=+
MKTITFLALSAILYSAAFGLSQTIKCANADAELTVENFENSDQLMFFGHHRGVDPGTTVVIVWYNPLLKVGDEVTLSEWGNEYKSSSDKVYRFVTDNKWNFGALLAKSTTDSDSQVQRLYLLPPNQPPIVCIE